MPEEIPPLRTNPDPPTPPAPEPGYVKCDFCECRLTKRGQVYEVSEKAVVYRDEKETHRKAVIKLDEEIAALRSQIAAKDTEIAALKGSPSPSRGGIGKL
jgi:hypothetical protein